MQGTDSGTDGRTDGWTEGTDGSWTDVRIETDGWTDRTDRRTMDGRTELRNGRKERTDGQEFRLKSWAVNRRW